MLVAGIRCRNLGIMRQLPTGEKGSERAGGYPDTAANLEQGDLPFHFLFLF